MSACTEVNRWMTQEVLVPVTTALRDFRESCEEVRRWFEEQVSRPVEDWVRREEQRCREQACNWWCLCCNKWFCWIAVVVIKVITWVVVTVIKWVVVIVCQVVAFIVELIVTLVLVVLKFLVSFFVCLFTDPEGLGLAFADLWSDVLGLVDSVVTFVETLLDDVVGILDDVIRFVNDLGESFGPLGVLIAGVITGVLGVVRDLVDTVRQLVDAVGELILGLLRGNLCAAAAGLTNLGVSIGRAVVVIIGGFFGALSGGSKTFSALNVRDIVRDAIERAFDGDESRIRRSLDRARIFALPAGLPLRIDARRMVIRSSEFVRQLHTDGVLDLYAIAGHASECKAGWSTSTQRIKGEVVYHGSSRTVSYGDLNVFLRDGPEAVTPFDVYPIRRDDYTRYLRWAQDRGRQVGVEFTWDGIGDYELTDLTRLPLPLANPVFEDTFEGFGRSGTANDDLSVVPALAVFTFGDDSFNGQTAWYRPEPYASPCHDSPEVRKSGVAFITRNPEWVFKTVLIHEIGHYLGLCHQQHDGLEFVMFSPKESSYVSPNTVWEYLGLGTEPHFTEDDAREVWRWLTTVAQDSCLP